MLDFTGVIITDKSRVAIVRIARFVDHGDLSRNLQVCMKPGDSLSGVRYIVLEVFFHNFTLTTGAPECLI